MTTTTDTTTPPAGRAGADTPDTNELGHMAKLADLADQHAAAWKATLAAVPGGRMRARVRPWADAYRADALGLRLRGDDDGAGE